MSEVSNETAKASPDAAGSNSATTLEAKANPVIAGVAAATLNAEGKSESKPEIAKEEIKSVPEKYELKIPEGSLLEASRLEEIAAFAKAQGFSNETAQAVLERESSAIKAYNESQQAILKEMVEVKWVEQVKADKEIGGEKFRENVELAHRALAHFGSEDFKNELNRTGFGNHPELVRVFAKVGRMMANDQAVKPGVQTSQKKSTEDLFYPSEAKQ